MDIISYVINLEPSIARFDDISEHFEQSTISLNRFEGIKGKDIVKTHITDSIYCLKYQNDYILYNSSLRMNNKEMTLKELGAAWSHFSLYKKLLHEPDNVFGYLIFEDDARIIPEMMDKIQEYLANIPKDAELVQLSSQSIYKQIICTNFVNDYYMNIKKEYFNCAASYFVTKAGALKLLTYLDYMLCVPADDLLSNSFMFKDLKVVAPKKFLFTIDYSYKSDIHS